MIDGPRRKNDKYIGSIRYDINIKYKLTIYENVSMIQIDQTKCATSSNICLWISSIINNEYGRITAQNKVLSLSEM